MNQCERIMSFIVLNGSITQKDAMNDLGVYRLASRIADLKREGYNIQKEMTEVINRYGEKCHIARYSLAE